LSNEVVRRLDGSTRELIGLMRERIRSLEGREDLLSLLKGTGDARGEDFFGDLPRVAIGIDGSLAYDDRLEFLLVYVCATSYKCGFRLEDMEFDLKNCERDYRSSISEAVPIWSEDLPEISEGSKEMDREITRSIESIPYSLMTLAEIYLAFKAVGDGEASIVFMDRPISSTYSILGSGIRRLLKREEFALSGMDTEWGKLGKIDLRLVYMLGSGKTFVPARGLYLPYAVVRLAMERGGRVRLGEVKEEFGLDDKELKWVKKRLKRINKNYSNAMLKEVGDVVELREGVGDYWKRAVSVSESVIEKIFEGEGHPLYLKERGRWITPSELDFVGFVTLQRLVDMAVDRGVLLIGITKDTLATEFTRSVMPYYMSLKGEERRGVPRVRSDRALLAALSSINYERLKTPWRTISYDSSFVTTAFIGGRIRPARKVITKERLFVRSYFQLREFGVDRSMRSFVFLYDRPYYPKFDDPHTVSIETEDKGRPYTPFLELNESFVDDLVLKVLSKCDNPEIFEAFGHNQLLYLADKAVKAEVRLMKESLRRIADLRLGTITKRGRFYMLVKKYREYRKEEEERRRNV